MYYNGTSYKFEKTKDEYEKEIIDFSFNWLQEESDSVCYKNNRTKLIELIYNYVMSTNISNIDYGEDIVILVDKCIKKYDPAQGEFLHYFNRSFMFEKNHMLTARVQDSYGGLGYKESEILGIQRYKKALDKIEKMDHCAYDINLISKDVEERIAEEMGITLAKAKKYRWLIITRPVSENTTVGDSKLNVIEYAQGRNAALSLQEKEFRPEDVLVQEEDYKKKLFDKLEQVFLSKRKDAQSVLKVLLTAESYSVIIENPDKLPFFKQYSFFDMDTFKKCLTQRRKPTHRDIAEWLDRDEASISRSWQIFIDNAKK